jgi:hypothetical protein
MCFSMKIQTDLKVIKSAFQADIDQNEFDNIQKLITTQEYEL